MSKRRKRSGMPEEDWLTADETADGLYPETEGSGSEEAGPEWTAMPDEDPGETEQPSDFEVLDDAEFERHSIFKKRERKPNFVLTVAVRTVQVMAVVILLAAVAGAGVLAGVAKSYVETAPVLDTKSLDEQDQTSFIYDRNWKKITDYKGIENRVVVPLGAMPRNLQHAFVAVEDARFYEHNGVDVKRIAGAFVSNMSSSSTQGGSTITQQLIKNTQLSSEQSYKRKIQEAYLAMELEQTLTQTHEAELLQQGMDPAAAAVRAKRSAKNDILESYLNTIWLGESYYGVQVAARGYFDKELGDLTLRECAMLAGLGNSPYYYNPRRNFYTREKEGVDYVRITNDRTDYVLRRMYECEYITEAEYRAALDTSTANVLVSDPSAGDTMYPYAHYVEYAVGEIVDIFLQMEGLENTPANRSAMESKFRTGGYKVQLALDPEVQSAVQSTLADWTQYPALSDPADKVYRSSNGDGTYTEIPEPQAAAVVMDYHNGQLLAIVGSRTEPTARKTLNRATDMRMPVGSSIKPLTVYAPALERGYSPASVVMNMPLPIAGWKNNQRQDWYPSNYGGSSFTGPVTLRTAMQKSYNTAAAQTMMTIVGVPTAVDYLHRMGVDDHHIDATPFGVTLGSSGITPLQMTVAYGTLANGGVYLSPVAVLGIQDSEGNVVWDGMARQERRQVFRASTAYMIIDMLKDAVSGGTGTKAKISGQTVAGKTGTNSDQKGVTFAGVTGYYASCLWVGHDNYKALSGKTTGSNAAAPLWQAYMAKIHRGLSNRDIMTGDYSQYDLVRVTTCKVSGLLATDACRADEDFGVTTDLWRNGTQPTAACMMHTTEKICLDTGMTAGPYCTNTATRSVISIPAGHPLYQFLNTRYEDTIRKYLTLSSATGGQLCTIHSTYAPQADPAADTSGLAYAGDARSLIEAGRARLATLDPASAQAAAIRNAIDALEALMARSAYGQTEIFAAMGVLSQAMAGIY